MSRSLAGLALCLLFGCFNPHYASPGFSCSTDVSLGQGCPPGQVCVNSLCVDQNMSMNGKTTPDLVSSPGDLASSSHDLASPDLSVAPDLASPGDLAVCLPTGGDCNYHKDSICCSGYCIYSTEKCS